MGQASLSIAERVLIWAAAPRDAELTREVLSEAGIQAVATPSLDELCRCIGEGAGLVVVGEEALESGPGEALLACFEGQPVWSDLPMIVLARHEEAIRSLMSRVAPLANVTLLERPVRLGTLVSAAQAALRGRRRQYEVRDLVDRLAEHDRQKNEFLAMLGHELRNPLGAMSTAVALLEHFEGEPETHRRHVELAKRQVHHLTRMMDDLLDLSRLSRGRIELRTEAVDVVTIVRQAVEAVELAGPEAEGRFDLDLPDERLPVDGDSIRLEQIVSNLLRNAAKYTPEGERIEVAVGRRPGPEGERVRIRVRDRGIGIDRDDLETIFDPFIQRAPSHGQQEGGLGIGLYLSRRLAELHGGTVEGRSAGRGEGSEFVVLLPLLASAPRDDADERVAAGDGSMGSADGTRVLLVEDNPEGREAMAELLELWGCRVRGAASGEDAVAMALEAPPDVALIDIGLPDLDGYEVARRIRSELPSHRVRLVALTGFGQPSDRRRALEAGFDEHLVKPVDPSTLSSLLGEGAQPARRATK